LFGPLVKEQGRNMIEVACGVHVRRHFLRGAVFDLMRSTVMLACVRLLYNVDREDNVRYFSHI